MAAAQTPERDKRRSRDSMVLDPSPVVQRIYLSKDDSDDSLVTSPSRGAATIKRNKANRLSLPAPKKHRRDDMYLLPESPVMKAPVLLHDLPNARQHRRQDTGEPQSLRARKASPERLTEDEISLSRRDSITLVKSPTVKHPLFLAQSDDYSGIPDKKATKDRDSIIVNSKPLVLHNPPKHNVPSGASRPDRLDGVGSSQGEDKAILPPSPVVKQTPPSARSGSVSTSRNRDSLSGPGSITLQKPDEQQTILSPEENTMLLQPSPAAIKLSPFLSSQERPFKTVEETPKVKIQLRKQPTGHTPAEPNSIVLPSPPLVRAPAFPVLAQEEQRTVTARESTTVSVGGDRKASAVPDERQESTGKLLETDIDALLGLEKRPRWDQDDNNMIAGDASMTSVNSLPVAESEIIPQYRVEAGTQPEHQTLFPHIKPERLPPAEQESIKQEDLIVNGSEDGENSAMSPSTENEPESGFFSLKCGQEDRAEAEEHENVTEADVPSFFQEKGVTKADVLDMSQQEEEVTEADVPSLSHEEEVTEADVPSMSQQEEEVTEADVPSMSQQEEEVTEADVPSMSQQEEEVTEADVPSMSHEEEVTEADVPSMSQEEEVTEADAASISQDEGETTSSEPDSDDYEVVEVRATDIYTPTKIFTEELVIRRRQRRSGKTQWSYKVNRRSWGGGQSDTSPSVPDVTAPAESWPSSGGPDVPSLTTPVSSGQQQSKDPALRPANISVSPQTNDANNCPPNVSQSELPKDLTQVSPAEKSPVAQRETSAVLRSPPTLSNGTYPTSPLKDKPTVFRTPMAKKPLVKKERKFSPAVSPPSSHSRPAIETTSHTAARPISEPGHNKNQSDLKHEELPETLKNKFSPKQEKPLASPVVTASHTSLPSSPFEMSPNSTGTPTNETSYADSTVKTTNGTILSGKDAPDTPTLPAEATQSVPLKEKSPVSARTGSFFSLRDDPSTAQSLPSYTQGRSSTVKTPLLVSKTEASRKLVRPSKRGEEPQLPQTKIRTSTLSSPSSPTLIGSRSPPRPQEERATEVNVSKDLNSQATSTNPESKATAPQAGASWTVNRRLLAGQETQPPAGMETLPEAGTGTTLNHRPLAGTETLPRGKHFPAPSNGSPKQNRLPASENSTKASRTGVPSPTLVENSCWPAATSSKKEDESFFSNTNFVEDDARRHQPIEISTPETSFLETEATGRETTAEAADNSAVTVSETEMRTFWRLMWTPVENASGYMHQQINRALRGPDRRRWWLFLLAVLLVPVVLEYRSRHLPTDPAP